MTMPKAAVDLPLPGPVLTITTDGARTGAGGGASVGGVSVMEPGAVPT